ncbi:uncharacterized protein LOC116048862 isoform X2 [Sander lucioperca]|uniref:uncharacterized protein LOC116048862 isoform X2 n=1 Tax=Sander lucioperca TaxID=283035 RepID=UPI0016538402|nr:uncharacterized protein LOC116048862 isoform X2 [Sander lucioperca]
MESFCCHVSKTSPPASPPSDPVSPVKLSVDSVSSSSDWCNLTVSCRAQDSHINSTFRCLNHTCSQEGGERSQGTPSAVDLHVYLSTGSIICNHSNQVSWTKDIKIIKHFCPRLAESEPTIIVTALVLGVIGIVFICILIVAAVRYFRKREKNETESRENTVYEVPQLFQLLLLAPTCLMHTPLVVLLACAYI